MTMMHEATLVFRQLGRVQLKYDVISSCGIRSQWNASLKPPPDIVVIASPIYQTVLEEQFERPF